jgi:signal transduction histidine kinase
MLTLVRTPAIIVVDDDEGLRLLISDALRDCGYAVAMAASGASAIASLRERRPDLMLLDLQLDDTAGSVLLTRLKVEGLMVPFVVVTGQGNEKVAVEMMKQGALDYVMKDTAILELLPVVVKRALAVLEVERKLAASRVERLRLEKEVLDISEQEKQRIGADLHDGLGQQLTAIELMCVGLKEDVGALDSQLGEQLGRITGLLRETIAQTRSLARGLAPLDEQPDAFQSGLASLAEHTNSLGRLRCRVERLSLRPLDDRIAAGHLFRIAQEALNNAIKHSGASEVTLRWDDTDDAFRLEISDNGKGIPEEEHRGMGLGIMNYRAGIIGATLTVESKANKGTSVVCVLPRHP